MIVKGQEGHVICQHSIKVHYNQKLGGGHSAILGGNAPWPLGGGIDAPADLWSSPCFKVTFQSAVDDGQ